MGKLRMNSAAAASFFEGVLQWLDVIHSGLTAARQFSPSAAIMKHAFNYCADHQDHQNRHRHILSLTTIVTSSRI